MVPFTGPRQHRALGSCLRQAHAWLSEKPAVVVFPSLGCAPRLPAPPGRGPAPSSAPHGRSRGAPATSSPWERSTSPLPPGHTAPASGERGRRRILLSSCFRKFESKKLFSSKVEPLSGAEGSELGWRRLWVSSLKQSVGAWGSQNPSVGWGAQLWFARLRSPCAGRQREVLPFRGQQISPASN